MALDHKGILISKPVWTTPWAPVVGPVLKWVPRVPLPGALSSVSSPNTRVQLAAVCVVIGYIF